MQFQPPVRRKNKREFFAQARIGDTAGLGRRNCADQLGPIRVPAWLEHACIACFRCRGIGGRYGDYLAYGELCQFGFAPGAALTRLAVEQVLIPTEVI